MIQLFRIVTRCFITYSLIHVTKDGPTVSLKLKNFLGDLTDEWNGDSIHEFVTARPKSYAYQTRVEKVVLRVKGIMQTRKCHQTVNFDNIKELVE